MTESSDYPRDMTGYGQHPPTVHWPGGARIAVQFVINYEEGGENCVLHGDAADLRTDDAVSAGDDECCHGTLDACFGRHSVVSNRKVMRTFFELSEILVAAGGHQETKLQRTPCTCVVGV